MGSKRELAVGQGETIKALTRMIEEIHGLNDRLDNILIGPLGCTVLKNGGDIEDLQRRVEALAKRTG